MKSFSQLLFELEETDYKLDGKMNYKGIPVHIENAAGSLRKGQDKMERSGQQKCGIIMEESQELKITQVR